METTARLAGMDPYVPRQRDLLRRAGQGVPLPASTQQATTDPMPDTATEIVAWLGNATDDTDAEARARAAREVNDARDKPWKTVGDAVDAILG
jgi:hypothetical protein